MQGFVLATILLVLIPSDVLSEPNKCSMDDEVCEFWLEISHRQTMVHGTTAVYPYKGKLYKYNVPEDETHFTESIDPDEVIVADGWETQRMVTVVNNTLPGPTIEVYKDQHVIIHVKNNMLSEGVSMHWHGLTQWNTPWMDGVSFITQCPIDPGQTFTYRFHAWPSGTFWYHSHEGSQRGDGLSGAFIIREREPLTMPEHIMLLQDWNHDYTTDQSLLQQMGSYQNRRPLYPTQSLDGAIYTLYPFHAGLINGRGRYLERRSSANSTPLTIFNVTSGTSYRFRSIGGQNQYPFRVSVDNHMLTLVASDGRNLKPELVESFIINPGERFDFVVNANQTVGNYWIRAQTLEVKVTDHIGLAILRYDGAPDEDPTSERRRCTAHDVCVVANCPFLHYPIQDFTECLNFERLKSAEYSPTPGVDDGSEGEIEEVFFDFGFAGPPLMPSSINGISFVKPQSPPLTQPQDVPNPCSAHCPDQEVCFCTSSITIDYGKVYNFIFTNMGDGKGTAHPIHMHGRCFHVLKVGYPQYNKYTGRLEGVFERQETRDIYCPGGNATMESFCNNGQWADRSWGGNNIPDLELHHPPLKDTITVPAGGYVVARFKADNPGVWYMHCHIDFHSLYGMAILINESFPLHPPPPKDFRKCGSFLYDEH